jgi:hypothetical protein
MYRIWIVRIRVLQSPQSDSLGSGTANIDIMT